MVEHTARTDGGSDGKAVLFEVAAAKAAERVLDVVALLIAQRGVLQGFGSFLLRALSNYEFVRERVM
jgi:hypothetical protein